MNTDKLTDFITTMFTAFVAYGKVLLIVMFVAYLAGYIFGKIV